MRSTARLCVLAAALFAAGCATDKVEQQRKAVESAKAGNIGDIRQLLQDTALMATRPGLKDSLLTLQARIDWYSPKNAVESEGKIMNVTPATYSNLYADQEMALHVMLFETPDKLLKLYCMTPEALEEGRPASVSYVPFPEGKVSPADFISLYFYQRLGNKPYNIRNENAVVFGDGVIIPGGIEYK